MTGKCYFSWLKRWRSRRAFKLKSLEVGHSDIRGSLRLPIPVGDENDLPERPSRVLKNCVEQQFLSSFTAFSSAERFFALFFALPCAPCGVSAPCRDTTARTYCARTAAATRFLIRTRL